MKLSVLILALMFSFISLAAVADQAPTTKGVCTITDDASSCRYELLLNNNTIQYYQYAGNCNLTSKATPETAQNEANSTAVTLQNEGVCVYIGNLWN